ncbi:CidA/LrgA family protein [Entomospira entomophila]|uniref:CidA/LrgA family protein n=1 Tax=Entomospira entomophila TaxID=2719988 RepID=A0A968KWC3_9SPIO|nr:CidA/LrgA family protein [Entomospira entomophilus]NIZ40680.1 CidA/LrgA family protein [Entomospira entomophilus]WDI34893.1 CidA/LrgA family protein [Entomospira entomophilus]
MLILNQLMTLFLFGLAGHLLAIVIPLPALILAMLLLFISLLMGWIKKDKIELVSSQLMAISGLFFIPMIVGIIEYWRDIGSVIIPFLLVVTFGTVGSLALTALILEWMIHRQDAKEAREVKLDKSAKGTGRHGE